MVLNLSLGREGEGRRKREIVRKIRRKTRRLRSIQTKQETRWNIN